MTALEQIIKEWIENEKNLIDNRAKYRNTEFFFKLTARTLINKLTDSGQINDKDALFTLLNSIKD